MRRMLQLKLAQINMSNVALNSGRAATNFLADVDETWYWSSCGSPKALFISKHRFLLQTILYRYSWYNSINHVQAARPKYKSSPAACPPTPSSRRPGNPVARDQPPREENNSTREKASQRRAKHKARFS